MSTPFEDIGYTSAPSAERGAAASAQSPGATPSNRAPDKCIGDDSFRVLWQGVDSLELSFHGSTDPHAEKDLERLRDLARSRDSFDRSKAQYVSNSHTFFVSDRGSGFYPFVLSNHCFRICLASTRGSRIPMALCQIRSEYLAHKGVTEALIGLHTVLTELGVMDGAGTVSRADLAVDFVTDAPMTDWDRRGWVTRARDVRAYWEGDLATGWTVGLGGPQVYRQYLKSHEIDTRSHKFYLHELWQSNGWTPGRAVWRAEGQFRRELLRELGVTSVVELLSRLPGLWQYLTGQWVRYAIPSDDDTTRSRWPLHSIWCSLAGVSWVGDPSPLTRHHKPSGLPSDEYLGRVAASALTSLMARDNIHEPDRAWDMLFRQAKAEIYRQGFFLGLDLEDALIARVREKGRKYFTMNNVDARTSKQAAVEAHLYRRESDGG